MTASHAAVSESCARTGHENDLNVHLALNSGLVVSNPAGGFYFVFLSGVPQFRKYDENGRLVFERHIEDAELDRFVQMLPTTWKRQKTEDGEIPLVLPSVLAAAADRRGNLWISTAVGVTFVYDGNGEKRRAVQFRAAGILAPTAMSFTSGGRLLVTPGCYAFPGSLSSKRRLAGEETRNSWQHTVLAARHAEDFPVRVDVDLTRQLDVDGARLKVRDPRIGDVLALGHLPRQGDEFQRAHRLDQADVEQPVVDHRVRRNQAAAADQARVADGEGVEPLGHAKVARLERDGGR